MPRQAIAFPMPGAFLCAAVTWGVLENGNKDEEEKKGGGGEEAVSEAQAGIRTYCFAPKKPHPSLLFRIRFPLEQAIVKPTCPAK